MTHEITDDDRAAADRLLPTLDPALGPISMSERIAFAIAQARAEAHAAGWREGVEAALAVAAREPDAAEAIRVELLGITE